MTTEFTALNLRPELEQVVIERGYITPSAIQAGIIPIMLTGADVIGQAQTGTGKTAAFALPILHNLESGQGHIQALVLAPTRELALQVADAMTEYGQHCRVRVLAVYGGQPYAPQINQLKRGVDIVVGTPGRLLDLLKRKVLDLSQLRTLVLDEADEMLSMGFIEDIEAILKETPAERQTALFSATLPKEIRRLAESYMHEPQSVTIQREEVTLATIEQRYYLVREGDKLALVTRLFEVEDISSSLIFVRTRAASAELANALSTRGFPAEALNGDLSQDARERTLNRFRQGQIKVLVATDVAARGLDIDDISHVFNFHLPDDVEIFVHRIGRTGRAGKTGIAISLLTPFEQRRLRDIERFTHRKMVQFQVPTVEDVEKHRETALIEKLTKGMEHSRAKRELMLINQLVAEGHDPLELAAVAIKLMRGEEKQGPLAVIGEVRPAQNAGTRPAQRGGFKRDFSAQSAGPRKYGSHKIDGRSQDNTSHERGMVRLTISKGKMHGIRPNEVVSTIAFFAEIPGNTIGKIHIHDKHTFVDVPEQYVAKVLAKSGNYRIHKQVVTVEKA
jgi:ATP-dependent RNA helicase DeaD